MQQEVVFPYRESSVTMNYESIKEQSEFVQETKVNHRFCHGAAVGRLGRLHDYPFWMFPFLCLD